MTCSSSSRASGQQSPDLLLPLVHVRHEAEPVTGSSGDGCTLNFMLYRYVCPYMGHDCIFQGPAADATTHTCPLIPDKGYSPRVHSREHISVIANPLSHSMSRVPNVARAASTSKLHMKERLPVQKIKRPLQCLFHGCGWSWLLHGCEAAAS
ncbi:hypothetical protein FOC4_g10015371 [Fusarium odoratissimum]|uniref:Uncharacterized protein n=1 Tax=Fusarium oxysporum f. sp. cubense (strain race 4) TaxID=2502994 RepID=N1RA75_FUSC4|nr:hypothetical protein FOC4_g10015371 [Fusarium odoratissimum]